MVLRSRQNYIVLPVTDSENRKFIPVQKLFNHNGSACFTERITRKHLSCSFFCFIMTLCNDDPFTAAESIRLYYDRYFKCIDEFIGFFQRVCFNIFGCRHIMPCKEILHKYLGALKLCCLGTGSKDGQSPFFKNIYDTIDQWCFRTYDRQVNSIGFHKICQRIKITDIYILTQFICCSVTWRKIYLLYIFIFIKCQTNRIFSTTCTNNQYVHVFLRKRIVNLTRKGYQ